MKIKILCIGKLKEKYLQDACEEYIKRLGKYSKVEVTELEEEKSKEDSLAIIQQVIDKEGQRIVDKINKDDYVILLDLKGELLTSEQFAELIAQQMIEGSSSFCFIIGGSHGTSASVSARADYHLKLSNLTFPHQLVRVILLEAVYRCFKINNNEKYHK